MLKSLQNFDYHKELIETLLKSKLEPLISNLLMPILIYILFMDLIPQNLFNVWFISHIVLFIFRILVRKKFYSILYVANPDVLKRYIKVYLLLVFLSAVLWGLLFTLSYIYMDNLNNYIALAILMGLVSASVTTLSSIFHASFIFVTTIALFILFNVLYFGDESTQYIIAICLLIFMYVVTNANHKMYIFLKNNIDKREESSVLNKLLNKKVKEVIKETNNKEELLQRQSALVQMGEMISMIAHQWRQPLGAIVAISIDLKMQIELDSFDLEIKEQRDNCKKYFSDSLKDIDFLVQNMTTTIDDFRNFYKPNKAHSITSITIPIVKAINIVKNSFKSDGINIIEEYNSTNEIDLYVNEMMQVILNILKNAQDNFKEKNIENKNIIFTCKDIHDGVLIEICDNGGGIDEKVLSRIFNPYFSTKSEKNGTGLGLYMSKIIIEEHHFGSLSVYNSCDGACFCIALNKNLERNI
ncbi:MAG: HAMP domain-containing histidine kinase [Fluviicola sp.]|nr:HAMP domain-containing histidine kinase [Fluviicola sp.]